MSKEKQTLDKPQNGNDFIVDVGDSSLSEAILIMENLMAYGRIHIVKGVKYIEGTHEEMLDRTESWLNRVRKNYR
jgi:hypothetical protein